MYIHITIIHVVNITNLVMTWLYLEVHICNYIIKACHNCNRMRSILLQTCLSANTFSSTHMKPVSLEPGTSVESTLSTTPGIARATDQSMLQSSAFAFVLKTNARCSSPKLQKYSYNMYILTGLKLIKGLYSMLNCLY